MIFVTVGTHEQPFDRLIKYIDEFVKSSGIKEEVVIQVGYSTYIPKYCRWQKLYPYQDIIKLMKEARIVITHGGPSSFTMVLQMGKIPIVVPRQKKFQEHINNHQVEFAKQIEKRAGTIITVTDIEELGNVIKNFDSIAKNINKENISNNIKFNAKLKKIVEEIFEGKD